MNRSRTQSTHPRAGTAMIVAVVCLTLLAAITISLVRLAFASQQYIEREGWRIQSVWLAESALHRAAVRIESGEAEDTDEWSPEGIGRTSDRGHVVTVLTVDPDDESRVTITATADFPHHPTDRVRSTRSLTMTRSNDGNESAEESE